MRVMRVMKLLPPFIGTVSVCCLFLLYKEEYAESSTSIVSLNKRSLRGGSRGRGRSSFRSGRKWRSSRKWGSSGSSWGSSGGSWGSSRSSWGKKDARKAGIIAAFLIIAVVICCLIAPICCGLSTFGGCLGAIGACCVLCCMTRSQRSRQSRDDGFEDNVSRVKLEVDSLRQYSSQAPNYTAIAVPIVTPFSGEYVASYVDGGKTRQVNLQLMFTPVDGVDKMGGGYFQISGSGNDIDGTTTIEQGVANMDGTAWWVEQTVTGEIGLRVLSRGKFDFTNHTFTGTWLSNTFQTGSYISFQRSSSLFSDNKMAMPTNAPTVMAGVGEYEDVPLLVGTLVENQSTTYQPYKTDV